MNPSSKKNNPSVIGYNDRESGWRPETRALHASWHPASPGEPVVPSWTPSTIYQHPESGLSGETSSYTRLGNPNRTQLEQTLASLEGGDETVAFASGMAAVQAVFHLLSPGDHVLLPDDLYHGVRNLICQHYDRWRLSYDFVDMSDPEAVEKASGDKTRMLWLETPSNPMLKICDIAGLCHMARRKKWISVVDNTWTTPVIQRPLALGADLVLYSTTKYIGGHSDVLGGAVVTRKSDEESDYFYQLPGRLRMIQMQAGAVPSPFDCWLMIRSLKTLYVRIRLQSSNAQLIADRLQKHHSVGKVYYPGLEQHKGREIVSRQMDLPGGMISFQIKGNATDALQVVSASRLIIPATSLGSVESTWEQRKTSEYADSQTPDNLIRLSVGIEHSEDLWSDIEQSLAVLKRKGANVNDFQ